MKIKKIEGLRSAIWRRTTGIVLTLSVVVLLLPIVAPGPAQAQGYKLTVLHTFQNTDGANPNAGLAVDAEGNLYGTTQNGGASQNGTVYKLDAAGNYSVLLSFDNTDGSDPRAGLLVTAAGTIYGTDWIGAGLGAGSVFELSRGTAQAIYNFSGGADGAHPWSSVIRDSAGNFYGATWDGGNETTCHSCGVVYKLDPTGKETILHTFDGGTDGANMVAGVIRDAAGNVYGATYQGGAGDCTYQAGGCGIVFAIDPSNIETILHTFLGQADGAAPFGGLVEDASGNLFGTASQGGSAKCSNGCGVVYKIDASRNFSVFHSFNGTDGSGPQGDLALDAGGNLYGTTALGGAYNAGVVYKLSSTGREAVLYNFSGGTDGANPGQVRLLLYKGSIYGTTTTGGAGFGVVFKITP